MRKIETIISENITKYLSETRTEINGGKTIEIDNFDEVKQLINPESSDDTWFIKIVQRRKDNPSLRLRTDNYVKYYLIHSIQELEANKSEIKYLCIQNNARAYITANKRSKTECDKYAKIYQDSNRRHPHHGQFNFVKGHEIEYAYGRSFADKTDREVVMIDIDSPDTSIHNKTHEILKKYNVPIMMEYPSLNNGLHIFTKAQEQLLDAYLAKEFLQFDKGEDLGRLSTVGIDFDKNALLYVCTAPQGYRDNYRQSVVDDAKRGAVKMRQTLQQRRNNLSKQSVD